MLTRSKMYDHEHTLREILNVVIEDHSTYFEPRQEDPNPRLNILDKTKGKTLYLHRHRGRIMFGCKGMGISYNGSRDELPITEAAHVLSTRKIASNKDLVIGLIGSLEEKGLSADIPRLKKLKDALRIE